MLGGSVLIAVIRFLISLGGVILLYFLMSDSKYSRKKTILAYMFFSVGLIGMACIWYVADWEGCVRSVAFVMYLCFCIFSIWMSSDSVFLSLYKLALVFYLLAVFLICGIEIALIFFDGNVWADIITRIVLILAIALLIKRKVRDSIRAFGNYVESELDQFSATVMIISLLFGIGFILLKTDLRETTPFRLFQIFMNFFLTGALQLLVFRLYLHIGNERAYQKENELMQMNHRLLERNMELLEESVEAGRRIRHDARHHNTVIREYASRGQISELLDYLQAYEREMDGSIAPVICADTAVNNLLSAYTRMARKEKIRVTLDVDPDMDPGIPGIDLVTVLANAYENAIFGCKEVKKQSGEQECFIYLKLRRKKNKLIISCSNTCSREAGIRNGRPEPESTGGIGVLSIIRTAEKFDGEYHFKNENGVFVFQLMMNLPPQRAQAEECRG